MAQKTKASRFFGQFLLRWGVIDQDQLGEALELMVRENRKLGEWAVFMGLMSQAQVALVHRMQFERDVQFGTLAVEHGFLTPEQLDQLLASQRQKNLRIGEALVQLGHLDAETLEAMLEEYLGAQAKPAAQEEAPENLGPQPRVVSYLQDSFPRLVSRSTQVHSKLEPGMGWQGEMAFDHQVLIRVEGRRPVELGLGVDDRLGAAITMGLVQADARYVDKDTTLDALGELGNLLAGHVQRFVRGEDESTRIGLPGPGDLPQAGVLFPWVSPDGDGALIVSVPA